MKFGSEAMKIVHFKAGDTLVMKKPHPCGATSFKVLRAASDVRMVCCGCGRDITVPRIKADKNIKTVIPSEDTQSL